MAHVCPSCTKRRFSLMCTLLPTRKQNYNIMFIYKNKARDRLLRLFIARDAQQTSNPPLPSPHDDSWFAQDCTDPPPASRDVVLVRASAAATIYIFPESRPPSGAPQRQQPLLPLHAVPPPPALPQLRAPQSVTRVYVTGQFYDASSHVHPAAPVVPLQHGPPPPPPPPPAPHGIY